ncbi:ABC transporter permease [Candidatus Woesearchaeota archaeon]|nr:ABC transporter permease [Candidatus Woesearchaeota archaeon]
MKTSLLAVVFGPLVVILLIGLAFSSTTGIQLTIGYHAPDDSQLTQEFIANMEANNYLLKEFVDVNSCISELELGLIHTCIAFPENFVIEKDKENNITFYVDKSRINLVYTVIDSVSEQIGVKSEELSKSLTETLTSTLTSTATGIDSSIGSLIKAKKDMTTAITNTQSISTNLDTIDLEQVSISIDVSSDISAIENFIDDIIDEIESVQTTIQSQNETPAVDSIIDDLLSEANNISSNADNATDILQGKISSAIGKLDDVEEKMSAAKEVTQSSKTMISDVKKNLESINSEIDDVKATLESISRDINTIEITSSEQIINPISTTIQTVSADDNKLLTLFPYVLLLIVLFVGLLLSSTLVVIEKRSRASFRVFTTATRDEFFIISTFVTSFIIIAMQVALILGLVSYFVVDFITPNIWVNIVLLILSSSLFIMIGMAIGYLMSSQQGANMASISIGSVLLFISNLVLPLESISPYLQNLAQYNPYVLASETFRRSILFQVSFKDILIDLLLLLAYSVIIFILIVVFQKLSKIRYFQHNPHVKAKKAKEEMDGIWLKDKLIKTEKDFIRQINSLSEEEYIKLVKRRSIKIKKFVKRDLDKPFIASKIYKYNKKELLDEFAKANEEIIKKIQKKHTARNHQKRIK